MGETLHESVDIRGADANQPTNAHGGNGAGRNQRPASRPAYAKASTEVLNREESARLIQPRHVFITPVPLRFRWVQRLACGIVPGYSKTVTLSVHGAG